MARDIYLMLSFEEYVLQACGAAKLIESRSTTTYLYNCLDTYFQTVFFSSRKLLLRRSTLCL